MSEKKSENIAMNKVTVEDHREHLEQYSALFQNSLSASSTSLDVQLMLDEFAKHQHYMFSDRASISEGQSDLE